jgi:hypothetical protein
MVRHDIVMPFYFAFGNPAEDPTYVLLLLNFWEAGLMAFVCRIFQDISVVFAFLISVGHGIVSTFSSGVSFK